VVFILYTDLHCFISTKITPDSIELVGSDDGPDNGVDSIIKTNILDTTEEKHYYLYIDDFFGGLIGQERTILELLHLKYVLRQVLGILW